MVAVSPAAANVIAGVIRPISNVVKTTTKNIYEIVNSISIKLYYC